MATEVLYATSHLTGSFSNPDNAVGNTTGTWAGVLNTNTSATSRWAIGNPVDPLTPAATQTVRVLARKGSNSGTPSIALNLYQNGTLVQSILDDTSVTSTTGQTLTGTFTGSAISDKDNIEVEVVMSAAGGGGTTRNSAQIDYIELTADTSPLPAPDTPTGLTVGTVTAQTVALSWSAAANASTYTIRSSGTVVASEITGTSHRLVNLTASTAYSFTVEAVNATGSSSASSAVTPTTLAVYNWLPSLAGSSDDSASFETGVGSWWPQGSTAVSSAASANATDGAQVLRVEHATGDNGALLYFEDGTNEVIYGGQTYTFRVDVISLAGRSARCYIEWLTAANAFISASAGATVSIASMTSLSITATAPSNAGRARLVWQTMSSVAGEFSEGDSASLHEGSSTTYPGPFTTSGQSATAAAGSLTLAAQSATTSVTAVARTATAAALTLTASAATGTYQAGAQQATAASAALSLAAQSASPSLGGITRTASAGSLALQAQPATISAGPVTRTATAASLTLTAQAAVTTAGAQTRTANTANLTLTASGAVRAVGGVNPLAGTTTLTMQAQAASGAPGPVLAASSPASLALTAQPASASLGTVARTAGTASLSLTAQGALSENVGGTNQYATVSAASLVLGATQASGAAGGVARTASPAALVLSPQAATAAVSAVVRTASPAALSLTAQSASRTTTTAVTASPAALSLGAQEAARATTGTSRTAQTAALAVTASPAVATTAFPAAYPATVLVRGKVRVHLSGGIYL